MDSRLQHGVKFRALYLNLGMDRVGAANFLQVSERTLHNWEAGKHVIPFAAYKLLRLMTRMDLPGKGWEGWSFVCGCLVTPEGRTIAGHEGKWWSLLVRLSRGFRAIYEENVLFRRRLSVYEAVRVAGRGELATHEQATRTEHPIGNTGTTYGEALFRCHL
jgi:hypothetical protein